MPRGDAQPLRITRREARLEALSCAAALLAATNFTGYEGERISECDDRTSAAYLKIEREKQTIVRQLAKRAGVKVEDLAWESD